MGELDKKHRKEIEERVEDVKKTLKVSWMNILYTHFFFFFLSNSDFTYIIFNFVESLWVG